MAKFLLFIRQSSIYVRVTHNGERTELSTGQAVDPAKWDATVKRVKGANPASESINRRLIEVVARLRNIETDLIHKGQAYRAKDIKDAYEGKDTRKRFVATFTEYVRNLEDEPPATRLAQSTIKTYHTRLKNIAAYCTAKNRDCLLIQIDESWLDDLKRHLLNDCRYEVGHVSKHLGAVKTVMSWAVRRKMLPASPLRETKIIKPDYKGREIVYLSEQQMGCLEAYPFTAGLQEVADCCIVQAHTGMAYAELRRFSPEWIYRGMDGGVWIEFHRQKTRKSKGVKVRVPLDEKVLSIVEKYRGHPRCRMTGRCLPVQSNGGMNRQLKIIAAKLSFPEALSTHHFRKTAGMLLLNNDVPLETVANILGDTEAVVKTHYARVIEAKTSRDMAAYRDRMKAKRRSQAPTAQDVL